MNNLDKIYRQNLQISLRRLGLKYLEEQHDWVLEPFMTAFQYRNSQTQCLDYGSLYKVLFIFSKDSDLSKAIQIFKEFPVLTPEIFKTVFLGIL